MLYCVIHSVVQVRIECTVLFTVQSGLGLSTVDCRVYSPTFINFCSWAIKWTGFGFGAVNGCVAQFPTLGLSFGWLERFSDRPRMNLGLVCFRNRCF